jgi:hypothetical protein
LSPAEHRATPHITVAHRAIPDVERRRIVVFGFFEGSGQIIEIAAHHGFEQCALVLIMTVRSGLGDARRVSDRAKRNSGRTARIDQTHR